VWFSQTWQRSPDLYAREQLASQFHRQLLKRKLNIAELLRGRAVRHLKAKEIHRLAEALPGFRKDQALEAYRAVLQELLEETNVTPSSQLRLLQLALYRKTLATLLQAQMDVSEESIETELLGVTAIIQEQKLKLTVSKPPQTSSAAPEALPPRWSTAYDRTAPL
jgi:ribosomal protein L17